MLGANKKINFVRLTHLFSTAFTLHNTHDNCLFFEKVLISAELLFYVLS